MYCLQLRKEALVFGVMLFFSEGDLQHTELVSHTTWSGQSRGTQFEQTGQNLGQADSQVVEQYLPVRQYSPSLYVFHGTFDTGFHPSTSRKCVTGRKTRFLRESCQRRFATKSAIAGNSHNYPVIGGIKQTPISGPDYR